jgi:HEXXH motif-containing protein
MSADGLPGFEPVGGSADPALERYTDACERSLRSLLTRVDTHEAIRTAAGLAERLDRTAIRAQARHPMFRHWRSELAAKGTADDGSVTRWLDHLPRFLLGAVLMTSGDLPDIRVPLLPDGQLRLPGLPHHWELGPDADSTVLVGRRGGELRITHRGRARAYPVVEHPVVAGTGIELDATDPYVIESIERANATSDSPDYRRRDIVPADAPEHRDLFDRAAGLIERAWPGCLAELAEHIRLIVPISSEALAGWTSVTQLGAIYIRPGGINTGGPSTQEPVIDDPVMFTAEAMVHEGGHTRLQVLSTSRPLFLDQAQHQQLRSPLRKDVRPAGGVYHAAFVLARMTVFLCRAAETTGRRHYLRRAEETHHDLQQASDDLFAQVALSPAGRELLAEAVAAAVGAYADIQTRTGVMS